MGDSRRNSLVVCHAYGAQILEFRRWLSPDASHERFGAGEEKAGEDINIPAVVHCPLKRTKNRPFQPCNKEAILRKFPQVSTGLSKANLEKWFSCVNLARQFSVNALFNLR
jgi:hypothetical protein